MNVDRSYVIGWYALSHVENRSKGKRVRLNQHCAKLLLHSKQGTMPRNLGPKNSQPRVIDFEREREREREKEKTLLQVLTVCVGLFLQCECRYSKEKC